MDLNLNVLSDHELEVFKNLQRSLHYLRERQRKYEETPTERFPIMNNQDSLNSFSRLYATELLKIARRNTI